jgi:hypothetical protein
MKLRWQIAYKAPSSNIILAVLWQSEGQFEIPGKFQDFAKDRPTKP